MFEQDIAAHLKIAVTLYSGIIQFTYRDRWRARLRVLGALFFITSDFLIGRDNLIKNQPNKNRPYIMITYVIAQVFLAAAATELKATNRLCKVALTQGVCLSYF